MSYTGEFQEGKKWRSNVGAAGQFLSLDNIMIKIRPDAANHKIQIKTVSGNVTISGHALAMQGTVIGAPAIYLQNVTNSTWVDLMPVNIYGLSGSTQRIFIRTSNEASNQGVYIITANAGNLTSPNEFDKYGFTIERC